MNKLLAILVLLAAAGTVYAQTTTSQCWGSGTEFTCQTTTNSPGSTPGQYGYLHDAGKQAYENAGRALGQMLLPAPEVTEPVYAVEAVIIVKCEKYVDGFVSYSNGARTSLNLGNGPVDRVFLVKAKQQIKQLRVVELDTDPCP